MTRTRAPPIKALLAALLLLTVALAGCTQPEPAPSDEAPGDTTPADGEDGDGGPGGEDAAGVTLAWTDHTYLGSILTTEDGRTLYVFTQDPQGESVCTGGCANAWPPLTTDGAPTGPEGLAERLGTIEREDGTRQVTVEDRPLYLFHQDEQAGDANGQGRMGVWFALREVDEPGQLNVEILDGPGSHEVMSAQVAYFTNETGYEVEGYLATPDETGAFPGVVMISDWWGLNENIEAMADALASHGYHVLAVDLFHGQVAENPASAREQVSSLDQEEANANMQAALDHLRTEMGATAVASLGWCFGGAQSLQLALSGAELDATVMYYGRVVTDETQLEAISWPVQGIFGEEDSSIPLDQVRAFDRALTNLSIEHEVTIYEGVGHAFANPSGDAYGPDQAMEAWASTLAFLDAHLHEA
ncbi:MAG: dienelactone hydrolase family protein [Candidatus Thermoplasmatota archaeon]|nr:dienelactone hydrolase family protein [Candidatus Thermoplasmatota archaeon]